jgi:membrane protein
MASAGHADERTQTGRPAVPGPAAEPPPARVRLRRREYPSIAYRGVRGALDDNAANMASAIAFNTFLAIPSALLVALGAFSLLATPADAHSLTGHLATVMPRSAVSLVDGSLTRVTQAHRSGELLIAVGVVLALWSLSGAMQTVIWALNTAYDVRETRGFVKRRLIGLVLTVCAALAAALLVVLLVLGPHVSGWVGSRIGRPTAVSWVWWTAQWPILAGVLLMTFAITMALAPNRPSEDRRVVTPGAIFSVAVWLAASGAFAVYASRFSSYNKTWGTLSAVIVTLVWLWLSALALLVGAEVQREADRRRQGHVRGGPAAGTGDE